MYINLKSLSWINASEVFQSLLVYLFLAILSVFPIFTAVFYWFNSYQYDDEAFVGKYGIVVEGLNFKRLGAEVVLYPVFSMIRMNLFAIIVVYLGHFYNFQVFSNNFLTLFIIILQGTVKPFVMPISNKLGLFNEFMVLVVNYHYFCFTDFVRDIQGRVYVGFS